MPTMKHRRITGGSLPFSVFLASGKSGIGTINPQKTKDK